MSIPYSWRRLWARLYRTYDILLARLNLPSFFCSQCEKRIRHRIYHFNGLKFCQTCADRHVMELEARAGFRN